MAVKVRIKAKFTATDVKNMLIQRVEVINQAILQRLQRVGEKFIKNAREFGNYKDHTGNLRSSIGYVIFHNGTPVASGFAGNRKVGKEAAQAALGKAKTVAKGFIIITVAGMEYAAAVESKGYDVITASSILARDQLQKALKELTEKVKKMK